MRIIYRGMVEQWGWFSNASNVNQFDRPYLKDNYKINMISEGEVMMWRHISVEQFDQNKFKNVLTNKKILICQS